MQHERGALSRRETLQHHQHGQAHAVIQRDPVGRIRLCAWGLDQRLGSHGPMYAARFACRPELIEAEPRRHHDEPPADILDRLDVFAEQAGEGLLHDILRLGDGAEHPVCHVEQVPTMLTPGLDRGVVPVGSHPRTPGRRGYPPRRLSSLERDMSRLDALSRRDLRRLRR